MQFMSNLLNLAGLFIAIFAGYEKLAWYAILVAGTAMTIAYAFIRIPRLFRLANEGSTALVRFFVVSLCTSFIISGILYSAGFGVSALALQVFPPANADSDTYVPSYEPNREEIVRLLDNLKEAVKSKDAKSFILMLQNKPDYYYFGPSKEEILSDFDKALPLEIQDLLMSFDVDDAKLDWYHSGITFYYPNGTVLLSFYPDCYRKAGKCVAMNINNLRTPGVLIAHKAAENKRWEAAAERTTLVDLDNVDDVVSFLQGGWRISNFYACGIHSGGAQNDANGVIDEWVYIEDKVINIPVSSDYVEKDNVNTTRKRYSAGIQSCVVTSTEKVTLSKLCRRNFGYILNPSALQINFHCEDPDNLKEGDYSMDTRSLLLADGGSVVLLSVWETYVSLNR